MAVRQFLYRYKLYHIFFWLLLFSGWYFFRYQDFPTRSMALLVTTIKVVDLAFMVYITNYFLIPKYLYKKKYLIFALLFFFLVVISSLFKIYLLEHLLYPLDSFILFNGKFKERVYDNVIPHFLLVSTGAAFKLLADYASAQRKLGELAKEKAEAELGFLKSQINPHFLFNSLNSVFFLIDKDNREARTALHKFSEMLRYQLYEVNGEKIPLEKEIGYIYDYIHLQKLRKEDCKVDISIDGSAGNLLLEPLLLIPFVENSFKHLSHHNNGIPNEIRIDLVKQNSSITFNISNTTERQPQHSIEQASGIGLSNVKRRLELLYPNAHELNISQRPGWFDVTLKVVLNKDHGNN